MARQQQLTPGEYSRKMQAQEYWDWLRGRMPVPEDLPAIGPVAPVPQQQRPIDPNALISMLGLGDRLLGRGRR
jgi:hypothetical protein